MTLGIYGKPGGGKTTYVARIAQINYLKSCFCDKFPRLRFLRKLLGVYDEVYCTDETVAHTTLVSYTNLGKWKPARNSLLLLEEAGIGLDGRKFKLLSDDAAYLFALARHLGCDIIWSSQTVDVDKKLRQRTHKIYLIEKSWIPGHSRLIPIEYAVDVDDATHKMDDMYTRPRGFKVFVLWLLRRVKYIYRPFWYKCFDSFCDTKTYQFDAPC